VFLQEWFGLPVHLVGDFRIGVAGNAHSQSNHSANS
jgi:hypothetical protein